MIITFKRFLLLCALLAFPGKCYASSSDLPIPHRGALNIDLPTNWKEVKRNTPSDQAPTIEFERSGSPRGSLQITVLWSQKDDPEFVQEKHIREISIAGQNPIRGSVIENELPLQPLVGSQGNGFVWSATDKTLKTPTGTELPGEFPILTHGELVAGRVVLSITILSDTKDNTAVKEALAAVQTARILVPTVSVGDIKEKLQSLINDSKLSPTEQRSTGSSIHAEVLFSVKIGFFDPAGGKIKQMVTLNGKSLVLFLYDFQDSKKSTESAGYAAYSLWGEGHPSRQHTDELMIRDGLVVVLSGENINEAASILEQLGFKRFRA
jgi:hypothetical protein